MVFRFAAVVLILSSPGPTVGDAVIIADEVKARAHPDVKSDVLFFLFKGNTVSVRERVQGEAVQGDSVWFKVSAAFEGQEAYVHNKFLATGSAAADFKKSLPATVHDDRLKERFSEAQRAKIRAYADAFAAIATADQLAAAYRTATQLSSELAVPLDSWYQDIQQKYPSFFAKLPIAWLYVRVPGIRLSYGSEGTAAYLFLPASPWKEQAKRTADSSDDEFLALLDSAWGEGRESFGRWFSQTWDYGGESLLGQGIHTQILLATDQALGKSKRFEPEIKKLRGRILEDILGGNFYHEPSSTIVKEVKQIADQVKLSGDEKAQLKKRMQAFSKPTGNLHVDCANQSCPQG